MTRLRNLDDGWWLVITAVLVFIFALNYPESLDLSDSELLVLGLLSGAIYSFTNASDTRAVQGRKVVEEKVPFKEKDFLAIGGLFGVIVVWVLLPIIYQNLASAHGYKANLQRDIELAFASKLSFFNLSIPWAFLFAGLFTLLSTFATLKIYKIKSLDYYAILLAILMGANLIGGPMLFNEDIPPLEGVILIILILLIPIIFWLMPKVNSENNETQKKADLPLWVWVLLFLVSTFLRDLFVRGTLLPWEGKTQHFFISLCFRSAYFSVFILWTLYWLIWEKEKMIKTLDVRKLGLPLVSAITVTLAFALGTPVAAKSLSKGPLTIQVGNILLLSIVGVLYKTDGTKPKLKERLAEIYIREGGQISKFLYLVMYAIFVVVIVFWLYVRFSLRSL